MSDRIVVLDLVSAVLVMQAFQALSTKEVRLRLRILVHHQIKEVALLEEL